MNVDQLEQTLPSVREEVQDRPVECFAISNLTGAGVDGVNPGDGGCREVQRQSREPKSDRLDEEWLDVTDQCNVAIRQLHPGQMIHGPNFTLQDAMSVIELGDPKMDIGAGSRIRIQDCPVPLLLTTDQIILVCDRLLACIVTWLESHLLPQTVFTCVYLFNLDKIDHPGLRCFCKVSIALVGLSFDAIAAAAISEDEDFIRHAFGFSLESLSEDHVKELLREGLLFINPNDTSPQGEGISSRLEFLSSFYLALLRLVRGKTQQDLRVAEAFLRVAAGNLREMGANIFPGSESQDELAPGFYPDLNKHLLPVAPPRTHKILSRKTAFQMLETWTLNLSKISRGLDVPLYGATTIVSNPSTLTSLSVLSHVARYLAQDNPSILSRSILKNWLITSQRSFLFDSSRTWERLVAMDINFSEDEPYVSESECVVKLTPLVTRLALNLCKNRGRARRRLLNFLEVWDRMVHNIVKQCQCPSRENVHRFCTRVANFVVEQHVLLGFDCELYSSGEMCSVYAFLAHLKQFDSRVTSEEHPTPLNGTRLMESTFNEGTLWLYRAMRTFFIWMEETGLLPNQSAGGAERAMTYDLRFEAIGRRTFGPPYFSYDQFTDLKRSLTYQGESAIGELLRESETLLGFAKRNFDSSMRLCREGAMFTEFHRLFTLSDANMKSCARLRRAVNEPLKRCSIEFSVHNHFPLIKLHDG